MNIKQISKLQWSIFALALVHFAGLPFIHYLPTRPFFLSLTPITLILSAFCLIINEPERKEPFWFFALFSFAVGMIVEILGVATGVIFGEYSYGEVLGWKFLGVPWMIGINWMVCSHCCGLVAERYLSNTTVKALFAALLMVLLDVLIEPVAIKMEFWTWAAHTPGLHNYLGWYLISLFIFWVYFKLPFPKNNPLGIPLLVIMVTFFALLNFS